MIRAYQYTLPVEVYCVMSLLFPFDHASPAFEVALTEEGMTPSKPFEDTILMPMPLAVRTGVSFKKNNNSFVSLNNMIVVFQVGRAVEEAMPYSLPRLLYVNGVSELHIVGMPLLQKQYLENPPLIAFFSAHMFWGNRKAMSRNIAVQLNMQQQQQQHWQLLRVT